MNIKHRIYDRIYERKFAGFIRLLPAFDKRPKRVYACEGRIRRGVASDRRTPAEVKIHRLITMRIRARSNQEDWS